MKKRLIKISIAIGFLLLNACTRGNQPQNRTPAPAPTTEIDNPEVGQISEEQQESLKQALQLQEEEFNKAQQELNKHIADLTSTVESSYLLLILEVPLEEPNPQTLKEYGEIHIYDPAQERLTEKYEPHELALVQKLEPLTLENTPYKFQSLKGGFLKKTQNLYLKISNTHPYHEQGRIARTLALSVLEGSDEMLAEDPENQGLAYQMSQALMLNMDDSFLEESDLVNKESWQKWGQSIYENLSGKHFLTGRVLTDNERAVRALDSAYYIFNKSYPLTTFKRLELEEKLKKGGFFTKNIKRLKFSARFNI